MEDVPVFIFGLIVYLKYETKYNHFAIRTFTLIFQSNVLECSKCLSSAAV